LRIRQIRRWRDLYSNLPTDRLPSLNNALAFEPTLQHAVYFLSITREASVSREWYAPIGQRICAGSVEFITFALERHQFPDWGCLALTRGGNEINTLNLWIAGA
jgi:hypothetical protein